MRKFEKMKGFALGVVVTLLISTLIVPAFAATIEAAFNSINIKINGQQVAAVGQSYALDNGTEVPFSIVYQGTTYLPLRKIGELYSKDVLWDGATQTAEVNDEWFIEIQDTAYTIEFANITETAFFLDKDDIYSILTDTLYSEASITFNFNKYSNMFTGYFHDDFFFKEFPDYKQEILNEVNRGFISGVQYKDKIYLDAVNMIRFFRQYNIEFYRGNTNYKYTPIEID